MKNLSFHSLLRLKDDYTTNSHYLTRTFLFVRLGKCRFLFGLTERRVRTIGCFYRGSGTGRRCENRRLPTRPGRCFSERKENGDIFYCSKTFTFVGRPIHGGDPEVPTKLKICTSTVFSSLQTSRFPNCPAPTRPPPPPPLLLLSTSLSINPRLLLKTVGQGVKATLSVPRAINLQFPLQPHQKYDITQYGELGFS